jgi:hemerythrin-like domain-containing protein
MIEARSNPVGSAPSFLSLLDTHEELDELFLTHQEALLALDLDRARDLLWEFETGLRHHMRLEEELLLPIYQRAAPVPGGAVELFTGEHRKMLWFLERFKESMAELEAGQPDLKRRVIQLLDHQAQFKHLVEHHDLREQSILYPALDRVTGEAERRELLARSAAALHG